jgi:thiol-disulfide isomerase/thioredoxin
MEGHYTTVALKPGSSGDTILLGDTPLRSFLWLLPLAASFAQTVRVGEPAPPLVFRETIPAGMDGAWPALRGRPVVLEFWATWCGNCVAHIPSLNELAARFPAVQFISITDEEPAAMRPFLEKHPISGWVAIDRAGATFKAYGVDGRPQTMLIDKDGVLRGILHPAQLTESVLAALVEGQPVAPEGLIVKPAIFDRTADPVFALALRPSPQKRGGNFFIPPGALQGDGLTLKAIIAAAYSTPEARLEGPVDLLRLRYDFCVLLPAGVTGEWDLLRTLLEKSLALKLRREKRETVDALVLKQAGTPPRTVSLGRPMWLLADLVERKLGRMIIDETGLEGNYEFFPLPGSLNEISAMLRERLHLELVPARRPREVLVVESLTLPTYRTVNRR